VADASSNVLTLAPSLVYQRSSWGYLQITKETLQRLLYLHRLPSVILDAVFSFGTKITHEDDPFFGLCYTKLSQSLPEVESGYSTGVNHLGKLEYVEKILVS